MMKNPITMNFLLFIGFLVIGYSVSTRFYQPEYSAESSPSSLMISRSSNPIQSLNSGQRNILLIGVNTIEPSEAQLESLWLVTNLPSDSTLHMFPIFPSGNETISDFEVQLYRSFKLDKKNGRLTLGQDFIKTLEENNYWWSGYFVSDHVAMTEILNIIGEAGENRTATFGDQFILESPEGNNNPQKTFSIQLALMQSACQILSGLSQNPDLRQVFSLSPTHLLTDLDFNQFLIEWDTLLSNQQSPNCKFPTLEISRVDN